MQFDTTQDQGASTLLAPPLPVPNGSAAQAQTGEVIPSVPVVAPPPPPPAPLGPMIPRIEEWGTLPEPYQEFRLRYWKNFPQRLLRDMQTEDELKAAAKSIFLEHNGWRDDEGELPQPTDPAFVERCPTHLFVTAFGVVRSAATTLPNSLQPTRRR
jgi:hypothetical protein